MPFRLHPYDCLEVGKTLVRFPKIQVVNSTVLAHLPNKQNFVKSRVPAAILEGRRVAGRGYGRRRDTREAGRAPGVDFGYAGKRAVRFSYASSEDNIREAARRLGEYLGKRG